MKITAANIKDVYRSQKMGVETAQYKGYKLIDNLFVDSSGFGAEDEPALLIPAFEKKLLEFITAWGPVYTFITGEGQFQVYVGVFTKTGEKVAHIVAHNTIERIEGEKRIIRLYDTDIITFEPGKITLNTGGFNTRTTAARMNDFISNGYVYRKNWEMHCKYNNKDYKFEDDNTLIINI